MSQVAETLAGAFFALATSLNRSIAARFGFLRQGLPLKLWDDPVSSDCERRLVPMADTRTPWARAFMWYGCGAVSEGL